MTTLLTDNLALLTGSPNGVDRLRVLIRDLAVTGRLVPHEDDTSAWQWSTLGNEISGMDAGWSPACLDTPASTDEVWGVLRTTAVQPLRYVQAENKELPANLTPRPEAEVKAGDVLFTRAGPMNRVGISCLVDSTRPRLMLSDKIIRFRPNPQRLDGRFTALCLNAGATARYLEAAKSGMAASQVNISQAKLKAAPVPVPPLAEQHRIVAKVDELMALCDRLEAEQADAEAAHAKLVQALLASLTQARDAADFRASWQQLAEHFHTLFTTEASVDALKQTIVHLAVMGKLVAPVEGEASASEFLAEIDAARAEYEAMPGQRSRLRFERGEPMAPPPYPAPPGWEWRNLGSLLLITGGVTLGRKLAGREVASLPYLRVANVQRGFLVLDQIKEVEVPADEVEKYKLAPGDLLTTEGGDWDKVGRTAIWRGEIAQCLHQNHVFRSRPYTEKFSSRWVELYLNSPPARDYFAGSSKQTTNLASINMTQLRACAFPVPPLATQHRIVTKVNELLALCDELKASIAAARAQHAQLAEALVTKAVAA